MSVTWDIISCRPVNSKMKGYRIFFRYSFSQFFPIRLDHFFIPVEGFFLQSGEIACVEEVLAHTVKGRVHLSLERNNRETFSEDASGKSAEPQPTGTAEKIRKISFLAP